MTATQADFVENNVDQGLAAYVEYMRDIRASELLHELDCILLQETENLSEIAVRRAKALTSLEWTKKEVEQLITSQRGGPKGVHGYIAEFVETGVSNARRSMDGLNQITKIMNDNGPVDITKFGKPVQLKFYDDILQELKKVSEYPDQKLMISKEHYDAVIDIMSGRENVEVNGSKLSSVKIQHIKKAVEDFEKEFGSYKKWLMRSTVTHQQVQQNTAYQTIADEAERIRDEAEKQQNIAKQAANQERLAAQAKAAPNWSDANKMAGVGATVKGGLNFAVYVFQQHKEGKEIWEFGIDEWKAGGLTALKGGVEGGVSGYAIYGLTECANLSSPAAGAVVAGTFGLASAVIKYRTGQVDDDGFMDLVVLNAVDATGAAIGAVVGQALIPIPILGAVVGSLVATTALSLGKGVLNKQEYAVIKQYREKMQRYTKKLDAELQVQLRELLRFYNRVADLQDIAFNFKVNLGLRLEASINLAKEFNVPDDEVLHNTVEIDDYFLS